MRELGQHIIAAIGWDRDLGWTGTREAIDAALAVGVGGFLIRGGPRYEVAQLARALHAHSPVPLLVGADDVLVVLARSSDGVSLDLVLEPSGDVPLDAVELRFEELRPSAAHLLCNDGDGVRVEVAAGADGRGSATVRVDGPTRLRLVRAAESAR